MTTAEAFESGFQHGVSAAVNKIIPDVHNNTPQWLIDVFGGVKSDSGVNVNYSASMTIAYVFAATSIISGDVASLPLHYYDIEADGDKIVNRRHPAYWLLNGDASDWMSGYVLRETMQHHALLCGNAYARIIRDGGMRPSELVLLDPYKIEVKQREDGSVYYLQTETREEFSPRSILHIPGLGFDGLKGHSVIQLARNSFGLALAQDKHGAKHFANGASPNIVLKHPKTLDKPTADELLSTFEKRHSGSENTGRPALAAGGLEIQALSVSNEDAQWLDSRKFSRVEVSTWFQLPPHKLGDDSRIAYNSIEAENRSYVTQTLRRWLRRWEVECNRKLLQERIRRSFSGCLEHDTEQLVDTDLQTKVESWTKLREAKVVTGNEVRTKLRLPKVDGLDDFENPNTSSPNAGSAPPEPEPTAVAAHRELIQDRIERMISVEASQAKRASKDFDGFSSWVDKFYSGWTGKVEESLNTVFAACSSVPGVTLTMTTHEAGKHHVAASVADLQAVAGAAADAEHLQAQVTSTVNKWPERAEAFASFVLPEKGA